MTLLLKLAARNLWRNNRRTFITVLAVMFATLFAIAQRGVQLGTYEANISHALTLFSGFIQIQPPGFRDNPSLHKSFVPDEALLTRIQNVPGVTGWTPRVYADGLVSIRSVSYGAALFGLDPSHESTVSRLSERVVRGTFLSSDSSAEVVLGQTLLDNLKADIGDTVVILGQGYDGTLGNELFRVVGAVRTGAPQFDAMGVFVGLSRLQSLLAMNGRIHVIALSLSGIADVPGVTTQLRTVLDTSRLAVLPWQEVMPELKQSIELDNISGMIFIGILIVVVAFGILNTVLMSVTERFREFGVLLSLGMPQTKLVVVVFLETIMITVIGLILGNMLALGVNYYLIVHPIMFTGEYAAMMEQYGFLPVMRSTIKPTSFLNTSMTIFGISLLSTLYPLYRTSTLEPLKGIRYT